MIVTMKNQGVWSVKKITLDDVPAEALTATLKEMLDCKWATTIKDIHVTVIAHDSPQDLIEHLYGIFLEVRRLGQLGERFTGDADLTPGEADLAKIKETGESVSQLIYSLRNLLDQAADLSRILEECDELVVDSPQTGT